MRNIFRKNNKKKGFTLIELVVTIALLTVVMGMITGIVSLILGDYSKTNDYVLAMDKAKTTVKIIKNDLRTATTVCLTENSNFNNFNQGKDQPVALKNMVYSKDGKIYRKDIDTGTEKLFFSESYWDKYYVDLKFKPMQVELNITVLEIELTLTNKEKNKVDAVYSERFNVLNAEDVKLPDVQEQEKGYTYAVFNLPPPENISDEEWKKG